MKNQPHTMPLEGLERDPMPERQRRGAELMAQWAEEDKERDALTSDAAADSMGA